VGDQKSFKICVQHFVYTANQPCNTTSEFLFTKGLYCSLHYLTLPRLWIFTLQYKDICHCVIMGLVYFSHLPMYQIFHEFCVSPCSRAQTTDRTLTYCDTFFPLFDIALPMTRYYFKQNYSQFKSVVEGLGTRIHHIGLNEFSN